MSTLLGFDANLIGPGTSLTTAMSTIETSFTSRGWQTVYRLIQWNTCTHTNNGVAVTQAYASTFFDGGEFYFHNPAVSNTIAYSISAQYASTVPCITTVGLLTNESITSYELMTGASTAIVGSAKDWTLQSSPDGVTWTTVDTQTNVPIMQVGERRRFTVSGTPTARPWWRLNVTGTWGGGYAYINKIRLYTSSGALIHNKAGFIVRPPATTTIGDAYKEECVIIYGNTSQILIKPIVNNKVMTPKMYGFRNSVGGAVVCGIAGCGPNNTTSFGITASLSAAGVLTVTATSGTIWPGMVVTGTGVMAGSYIHRQLTGTTGSTGTYALMCGFANADANGYVYACTAVGSTSMTVNGSVVSITGGAASTSQDNLRTLYTAIKNSTDPNFTDYDWNYSAPGVQGVNDSNYWIYAVQKVPTESPYSNFNTINSSVHAYVLMNPKCSGVSGFDYTLWSVWDIPTTSAHSLNIDLTNGFIYYLQLNSAGGALATKTNTAYYGAFHFCYGDHAKALASMPTPLNPKILGPSELVMGWDAASTSLQSTAITGKCYLLSTTTSALPLPAPATISGMQAVTASYSCRLRDYFVDGCTAYQTTSNGWTPADTTYTHGSLTASGVFNTGHDTTGDDFQIHRMVLAGNTMLSSSTETAVLPQLDIQDWYKFRGTATNEALSLVPDTGAATTLNQVMDSSTAYTTITLASTASLVSSGFVVIENEVIQYTGISGNDLTGVTRAKFGTAMQAHWVGDTTYQGMWFTIINGSALYCGYTKPS